MAGYAATDIVVIADGGTRLTRPTIAQL